MKDQSLDTQKTLARNEMLRKEGLVTCLVAGFCGGIAFTVIIFVLALWSTNANAYSLFPNWQGVHFKPGINVELNIFNDLCSPTQLEAVQSSVRILAFLSNRMDPEVTYEYTGAAAQPGWGVWNRSPDNVTITFDCTDGLIGTFAGQSASIHNCIQIRPNNREYCLDGSKRYITGSWIKIGSHVPDWRIGVIALHEGGHAVWLLNHSRVAGSVMQDGVFYNEKSSQIQKVWSQDTFCAVKDKLEEVGRFPKEWPPTLPTLDDYANVHIPKIYWFGIDWELILLSDRISTWPEARAVPLVECSALAS